MGIDMMKDKHEAMESVEEDSGGYVGISGPRTRDLVSYGGEKPYPCLRAKSLLYLLQKPIVIKLLSANWFKHSVGW